MRINLMRTNFPDVVDGYKRSEVVLLDCRPLSDSNDDQRPRFHAGYHPKPLAGIVSCNAWDTFWREAHDSITAALARHDVSQVLVVCYCRVGRHRSVGVRYLLHHCLGGVGLQEVYSNDLCGGDLWAHLCHRHHANCRQCHQRGNLLELAQNIQEQAMQQGLALDGLHSPTAPLMLVEHGHKRRRE